MRDLCSSRAGSIEGRPARPSRRTTPSRSRQRSSSAPRALLDAYSWSTGTNKLPTPRTVPKGPQISPRGSDRSLTYGTLIPPFMRLPPEIRAYIYRFVLSPTTQKFKVYTDCDPENMDRKWDTKYRFHPKRPNPQDPLALLRTNRAIYFESLSVLYSESTFHFIGCNFLPIIDFIRRLSEDAKALVRQVRITMLPEAWRIKADQTESFYRTLLEWLPGLNVLASEGYTWTSEGWTWE